MRLAVISDIHANLEALQAALADVSAAGVDQIVCLGDIVGYNANPAECIASLRGVGALCVGGNHDRAVAGLLAPEAFGTEAARALAWTRLRLGPDELAFLAALPLQVLVPGTLIAVHGTLDVGGGCERTYLDSDERRLQCFASLKAHPSQARICAFGHTHRLGVFELWGTHVSALDGDGFRLRQGAYYLLNPGTIGEPRGGERRATYMVLDTGAQTVTVRRVPYDSRAAEAKTRGAGLARRAWVPRWGVGRALARGLRASSLSGVAHRLRSRQAAAGDGSVAGEGKPPEVASAAAPSGGQQAAVTTLGPSQEHRNPRA